jgi:L-lactate dehydrogenase complex protein LldG
MTSKDEILKAIRSQHPPAAALPTLDGDWIRYDDPFAQFQRVVESVGGRCFRVSNAAEIAAKLAEIPEFASAGRVVSHVPGITATASLDDVDDPHQLEAIDWAVMPGQFGVAENGAIWVTDKDLKHRAIYFIVQHLALVIHSRDIVNNMPEAYERVTVGESSLGVFISGPSKTADIEQSLVIGAHGPRSLTVFCVDGG